MELEELKCCLYLSCQLPNFALILYDLKEGCVEVTWLVARVAETTKRSIETRAEWSVGKGNTTDSVYLSGR